MNTIILIALLICGVVLLVAGIHASDSIASQFSRFFSGHPTDATVWMLPGGFTCALIGTVGLMRTRAR